MDNVALIPASKSLLTIWTNFLPRILSSRFSSTLIAALGVATFACGLGLSLYTAYQDLYFYWLEHKISRSLDQLDKLEAKALLAEQQYKALDEAARRGDRMIDKLECWDEERKAVENMLAFMQIPVACAITDDGDPQFEGYDVILQGKETRKKMKELVALDHHINEEIKWWNKKGHREHSRQTSEARNLI